MRILRSIVAPSTALMAFCDSKIMGCGSIRPQFIRDEVVWNKAVFLQQLAHEFQRRPLVPLWTASRGTTDPALSVDGAPQMTMRPSIPR
jgi:hypothetical protein